MFSVKPNFDMQAIHNYMESKAEEQVQGVVNFLRKKGMLYTEKARNKTLAKKPYNNITFNLVSSVGFAIARNSVVTESYFPLMATGTEGKAKGEALAEKTAREISGTDDVVLVLVAGEEYASFVQKKGKDVIKASSNAFEAYLLQMWGANR